jgi:hypothetical protein
MGLSAIGQNDGSKSNEGGTKMAEIKLSGWQAVVVIVLLIGVIVIRVVTLDDMTGDEDLMAHIDTLLMDEYAPYVADTLRDAFESGDAERLDVSTESVLSTEVNIVSVKASYPVFKFSTPKDVVIKVVFSLDDVSGTGDERTIYYLFRHGTFGWQYQYITSSMSYYLNFM